MVRGQAAQDKPLGPTDSLAQKAILTLQSQEKLLPLLELHRRI